MKYIIVLLITAATIGVYSCDPSFKCTEIDTLPVFDDLRNVDSILYMANQIVATSAAFDSLYSGKTFFINDNAAYQAMKNKATMNGCTSCVFPNIDFSRRTLVGQYFDISCDEIAVQRFVTTSDSTFALYSKFVNLQQCAFNTCPNKTFNWMLVPKVESADKVEYFSGNFYYDCDC